MTAHSGLTVRVGARQVPVLKVITQHTQKIFQTELYPHRRVKIKGMNGKLAQVSGYGACDQPNGDNTPILIPYLSTTSTDEYGFPNDGAPQPNDNALQMETTPSNPVVTGQPNVTQTNPFLSGVTAGAGVAVTTYGQYDYNGVTMPGKNSKVKKKPRVSILLGPGMKFVNDPGSGPGTNISTDPADTTGAKYVDIDVDPNGGVVEGTAGLKVGTAPSTAIAIKGNQLTVMVDGVSMFLTHGNISTVSAAQVAASTPNAGHAIVIADSLPGGGGSSSSGTSSLTPFVNVELASVGGQAQSGLCNEGGDDGNGLKLDLAGQGGSQGGVQGSGSGGGIQGPWYMPPHYAPMFQEGWSAYHARMAENPYSRGPHAAWWQSGWGMAQGGILGLGGMVPGGGSSAGCYTYPQFNPASGYAGSGLYNGFDPADLWAAYEAGDFSDFTGNESQAQAAADALFGCGGSSSTGSSSSGSSASSSGPPILVSCAGGIKGSGLRIDAGNGNQAAIYLSATKAGLHFAGSDGEGLALQIASSDAGLKMAGNALKVNIAPNGGLNLNDSGLNASPDGISVVVNPAGQLSVKGAAGSYGAGAGITISDASSVLTISANPDMTSIDFNGSGQLEALDKGFCLINTSPAPSNPNNCLEPTNPIAGAEGDTSTTDATALQAQAAGGFYWNAPPDYSWGYGIQYLAVGATTWSPIYSNTTFGIGHTSLGGLGWFNAGFGYVAVLVNAESSLFQTLISKRRIVRATSPDSSTTGIATSSLPGPYDAGWYVWKEIPMTAGTHWDTNSPTAPCGPDSSPDSSQQFGCPPRSSSTSSGCQELNIDTTKLGWNGSGNLYALGLYGVVATAPLAITPTNGTKVFSFNGAGATSGQVVSFTGSVIGWATNKSDLEAGYGISLTDNSDGSITVAWTNPTKFMTNPMATYNDMIVNQGNNAAGRLPVGDPYQVLTVSPDGTPTWGNDDEGGAGSGDSNILNALNGIQTGDVTIVGGGSVTVSASGENILIADGGYAQVGLGVDEIILNTEAVDTGDIRFTTNRNIVIGRQAGSGHAPTIYSFAVPIIGYTDGPLDVTGEVEAYGNIDMSIIAHPHGQGIDLALTPVAGTALSIGSYQYVYTYGTPGGGETTNSPLYTVTTTAGNQGVSITIPATSVGGVVLRNLYRTPVNSPGNWQFLTTVNGSAQATYLDTLPDSSLLSTRRPPIDDTGAIGIIAGQDINGTILTVTDHVEINTSTLSVSGGILLLDGSPISNTFDADTSGGSDPFIAFNVAPPDPSIAPVWALMQLPDGTQYKKLMYPVTASSSVPGEFVPGEFVAG